MEKASLAATRHAADHPKSPLRHKAREARENVLAKGLVSSPDYFYTPADLGQNNGQRPAAAPPPPAVDNR